MKTEEKICFWNNQKQNTPADVQSDSSAFFVLQFTKREWIPLWEIQLIGVKQKKTSQARNVVHSPVGVYALFHRPLTKTGWEMVPHWAIARWIWWTPSPVWEKCSIGSCVVFCRVGLTFPTHNTSECFLHVYVQSDGNWKGLHCWNQNAQGSWTDPCCTTTAKCLGEDLGCLVNCQNHLSEGVSFPLVDPKCGIAASESMKLHWFMKFWFQSRNGNHQCTGMYTRVVPHLERRVEFNLTSNFTDTLATKAVCFNGQKVYIQVGLAKFEIDTRYTK